MAYCLAQMTKSVRVTKMAFHLDSEKAKSLEHLMVLTMACEKEYVMELKMVWVMAPMMAPMMDKY